MSKVDFSLVKRQRLICLKEVIELTSLSRSSIYDRIQKGTFPAQIKLGFKSVWSEGEVINWIDKQLENSGAA